MNKDYTYCFGYNIFALADICKNCRRLIHDNQIPNNAIWWSDAQYDTNTGKCLLYEQKIKSDEHETLVSDLLPKGGKK